MSNKSRNWDFMEFNIGNPFDSFTNYLVRFSDEETEAQGS